MYTNFISKKDPYDWFCSPGSHIRMISKGSCDTEDWSNDAENSDLPNRNKLHLKIYENRKQLF